MGLSLSLSLLCVCVCVCVCVLLGDGLETARRRVGKEHENFRERVMKRLKELKSRHTNHTTKLTRGQRKASQADPEGRPKLVYDHLPKTGGTFIKSHISRLIPDELLAVINEFDGLTGMERKANAFVLGSIRKPCPYYLSLWSFGSHGYGSLWKHMTANGTKPSDLYGRSPPYNNPEDLDRFSQWLEREAGILTNRLNQSYGIHHTNPNSTSTVDCWVHTENLVHTLRACLEIYEGRGGVVDWGHFPSPEDEHINQEVHATCEEMYDEHREALVVAKDESVFKVFGFDSCC